MQIDLKGRLAVVTGGSGQLGRTICRTLAECGADVAVHYHQNQASAEKICAEIEATGRRARPFQADITDETSIKDMQKRIEKELGQPGIIVNNAVIQYKWVPVLEQSLADYESQFRSCVMHNVMMIQAFVPAMIKRKFGRVIAINTECAMQNFPTQSAYVAGKRGMDGVLRVLAREVGPHQITVNQVAPGWMVSENVFDGNSAGQRRYRESVPLRRRGDDQDVANLVAFLASDLADFISGQYISVSGGNVMPTI
ncbi:MAG TPA: SDR family oxidoreductase [Anaerolineaceae bacterium]|nr:SDR family oxidoreductase [Anaerolineaceae bacterium]HPN53431.1 SDR family oxidoreductase [Anaerolineaceae bacterium]